MYQTSVELVKKAELAARGFHIGALLPPVGRIERVTHLKCGRLRRQLRAVNELLTQTATQLQTRESSLSAALGGASVVTDTDPTKSTTATEEDANVRRQTPSLLLSALLKRHELANVALEGSLRTLVLACVSEQHGRLSAIDVRPTLDVLLKHFQDLRAAVVQWTTALDRSNDSRDRQRLTGGRDDSPTAGLDGPVSRATATRDSVAELQLGELRTACETLKHLVFAAQQDAAGVPTAAGVSRDATVAQALLETRELMRTTLERLNVTWSEYDKAVDGAGDSASDCRNHGPSDATSDTEVIVDDDDSAADARAKRQQEEDEDATGRRDVTLVFTGTSTGERDFDLKAIVSRQQSASPTPQFVRELQVRPLLSLSLSLSIVTGSESGMLT